MTTYLTKAKEWLGNSLGSFCYGRTTETHEVFAKIVVEAFARMLDEESVDDPTCSKHLRWPCRECYPQPTEEACDCAGLPEHCVCSKPPRVEELDLRTVRGEGANDVIGRNLLALQDKLNELIRVVNKLQDR